MVGKGGGGGGGLAGWVCMGVEGEGQVRRMKGEREEGREGRGAVLGERFRHLAGWARSRTG